MDGTDPNTWSAFLLHDSAGKPSAVRVIPMEEQPPRGALELCRWRDTGKGNGMPEPERRSEA